MLRFPAAFFCALVLANAQELEPFIKRFIDVYALVEREGADPVEPAKAFYEGAIPGMLKKLDPHSVFFDPAQFEQLRQLQESRQKGFGSVVSVLPGRVIVLQTLPGTPSAKSGLAPGDEIMAINAQPLERLDMEQLVELLGRSRQQQARLEVRRAGAARLLEFVLTPEELQSPSVDRAFFLRPKAGYVRVASFDEKTGQQVREAVEQLGGASLKALVLDLRNNPGGLLGAALETGSLFLKPGQKLLTVRGRKVPEQDQRVPDDAKPYTFSLAVLINGQSASAAEIVAGALQDHDRAVVVGEPSYGKGLVETVYPLSEGTGLALTTSLYYTPSGRSIQRPLSDAGFALAATTANPNEQAEFRTTSGRIVLGGGGIRPDHVVFPEGTSRLRAVLDGSGSFTTFATEYLGKHPKIDPRFEVPPALLDEFQVFLSERKIQPDVTEWSRERPYIRNRLKAEIVTQAFGVDKGDEVEAQRDPQVLKALEVLRLVE